MSASRSEAMRYWQRLRKDRPTAIATGAASLAGLATTLILLGIFVDRPRSDDRASPVYWLIIVPAVVWIVGLSGCSAWSTRLLRPATIVMPVVALLGCVVLTRGTTPLALPVACTSIAVVASIVSALALPRSLLAREGPDRR